MQVIDRFLCFVVFEDIDDVLGELDEKRKANFKDLLPLKTQVFATGTSFPTTDEKSNWESFQVDAGKFVKN